MFPAWNPKTAGLRPARSYARWRYWTAVESAARHRFRAHGNLSHQFTRSFDRKGRRRSRFASALHDANTSFEPSIDYVVTKIPSFAFEKFP
jgi:hypothetical protein